MKPLHIALIAATFVVALIAAGIVWLAGAGGGSQADPLETAFANRPASCDEPAAQVVVDAVQSNAEWLYHTRNSSADGGGVIYWGRDTIRRCGDQTAQIQIRVVRVNELPWGEPGPDGMRVFYKATQAHYAYHCRDRTFAVTRLDILNEDRPVAQMPVEPDDWRPVEERGASGAFYNIACLAE